MAYSNRYVTREYRSAHGISSTTRPCVGHCISRGQCFSQTVHPQTGRSRQLRSWGKTRTILPRRPHVGHRHPFLCGFTTTTNRLLPSNHQAATRSPLNLNSLHTNLFAVIGRPPILLIVLGIQPRVGIGLWPCHSIKNLVEKAGLNQKKGYIRISQRAEMPLSSVRID